MAGGNEADIMAAHIDKLPGEDNKKDDNKKEEKKPSGEDSERAALRAQLLKMSGGGDDSKPKDTAPEGPKLDKSVVKNKEKELIAKIK